MPKARATSVRALMGKAPPRRRPTRLRAPTRSMLPPPVARVLPHGVERAVSGWLKPPSRAALAEVTAPPAYQPIDTQNGAGRGLRDLGIDIDPNVSAKDWDRFRAEPSTGQAVPPAANPFALASPSTDADGRDVPEFYATPAPGRTDVMPNGAIVDRIYMDDEEDTSRTLGAGDIGITVRPVTLVDIDNLWDWVRSDEDHGRVFLGKVMPTSLDLHAWFRDLRDREASGITIVVAVDQRGSHVGFVVLDPISVPMGTAMVHIYLAPDVRGHLALILPTLLALADERVPALSLVVATASAAAARLYRPFGFETTFVLKRPARK